MEYLSSPLAMKILRKPFKEREGALTLLAKRRSH